VNVGPIDERPERPHLSGAVPAAGDVLAGQYRVERWLGDGGMGLVLGARDLRLGREVALKLVQPELASSEAVRRSFEAEARAMAGLVHPNVVTIYSFEEDEGRPFLVMELVDGPSLSAHLREHGRLSIDETLAVVRGVADGLTALHAAGVIHGDVKPSNVLLAGTGMPKLTDMGLSHFLEEESPGVVRGTPNYMPPERARGLRVARGLLARQDVYGLALTAFEMLTGRPPFLGSRPELLIEKHAREVPPSPSQLCDDLPPSLDAPLMAGLRKAPEERTATPLELALDLERAARFVGRRGEHVRLLVVDDDADWLSLMEAGLMRRMPGVLVDLARDGEEALCMARANRPSVAIVDLRMPRVDGEELTQELREIAPAAELPIVVLTAEGGGRDWRRLRRLGADRFFVKPVVLDELCDTIESLLRLRAVR
jgi:CheY-like chemotaxis protein